MDALHSILALPLSSTLGGLEFELAFQVRHKNSSDICLGRPAKAHDVRQCDVDLLIFSQRESRGQIPRLRREVRSRRIYEMPATLGAPGDQSRPNATIV